MNTTMTKLKISAETAILIRDQLEALSLRIPLKVWMVTRVNGDDWEVVYAHNRGYPVEEGQILRWQDSFCCRMMSNEGPQFASNAKDCEAYQNAPVATILPITIYVGVPLYGDGNRFIGTLCGLDPQPEVVGIRSGEGLVKRTADVISKLLSMELKLANIQSRALQVEDIAWRDDMTGLLNRRGWNRLIAETDALVDKQVHAVVMLDLDKLKLVNDQQGHAAGDKLIIDTARVLSASMRGDDAVARLGGDEFGILLRGMYPRHATDIAERLAAELAEANILATMGFASMPPLLSIEAAMEAADQMLIARKQKRVKQ
jgi:diguanylate cyclase (GGDEF)-like protein